MRRAARLPDEYAGNAFHLLHAPATEVAWHAMPLADVCALVRTLARPPRGGDARDDPPTLRGGWLSHARMLEQGVLPPIGGGGGGGGGGGDASCTLVANYQAHLPAFAVDFGGG